MNFLARNLKYLRNQKGITQATICASIDVPKSTYSNWETEVSEPEIEMLVRLSQFFEIELSQLIGEDLTDGKPIEKEKNAKNSLKGKANGKGIGKVYPTIEELADVIREPEPEGSGLYLVDGPPINFSPEWRQIVSAQSDTIKTLQSALQAANDEIERLKNTKK